MIEKLVRQWRAVKKDESAALCSVIQWKGSVPRKDYPMMLVRGNGSIIGTVGGGPMELQVIATASEIRSSGESRILDFDMTGDDVEGEASLCGGKLRVLIEPFTAEIMNFYENIFHENQDLDPGVILLTVHHGSTLSVKRDHMKLNEPLPDMPDALYLKMKEAIDQGRSKTLEISDDFFLLLRQFAPPKLHIFGAGHVGQAVADLAHFNQLEVAVYDDRLNLLTKSRFPQADLVPIEVPVQWEGKPPYLPRDFVLIASREHRHDRVILEALLKSPPAYIGLVSSSRKWGLLKQSLLKKGYEMDEIQKVHAPVGLDIHAQTVPEIAISILSEMVQSYRKDD